MPLVPRPRDCLTGYRNCSRTKSDRPSQAEIAREFGMTENAVKQAFRRLRQRYGNCCDEEIAHTVMAPGDIEDELRHLIAVLRA